MEAKIERNLEPPAGTPLRVSSFSEEYIKIQNDDVKRRKTTKYLSKTPRKTLLMSDMKCNENTRSISHKQREHFCATTLRTGDLKRVSWKGSDFDVIAVSLCFSLIKTNNEYDRGEWRDVDRK